MGQASDVTDTPARSPDRNRILLLVHWLTEPAPLFQESPRVAGGGVASSIKRSNGDQKSNRDRIVSVSHHISVEYVVSCAAMMADQDHWLMS